MTANNEVEEVVEAEIIDFPPELITRINLNTPEDKMTFEGERFQNFQQGIVNQYLSLICPQIFGAFSMAGFDVTNLRESKNAALVVETIRSFIEFNMGIPHPLQQLAEILIIKDDVSDYLIFNENSITFEDDLEQPEETINNETPSTDKETKNEI